MEKLEGIVLSATHHNDTLDIVSIYTPSHGKLSFLSKAGNTPAGRRRRARLLPLAILNIEHHYVAEKDLQRLDSFEPNTVTPDLYHNPIKRSITLFIADFLNRVLRTQAPEPDIYKKIKECILRLDQTRGPIGNYHLALLIELLKPLGIFPDILQGKRSINHQNLFFNLQKGEYQSFPPLKEEGLNMEETKWLRLLSRMTLRNCRYYLFNRYHRRLILSRLVDYYNFHLPGSASINSSKILSDL